MKAESLTLPLIAPFLLTSASKVFCNEDYWRIAERNLNFVLENQNPDGSWFYAVDGVRDFVDHYHTCFVMKALAKIHALTGHPACLEALSKGLSITLRIFLTEDGLPKPFSKAPRLTVYKRELYDCAECINLCLLLRDRFPQLESNLGERSSRNSESMGQARWIIPFPEATPGLGQRSHASLGTVADVSQPRVLSARGSATEDGVRGQKTENGRQSSKWPSS